MRARRRRRGSIPAVLAAAALVLSAALPAARAAEAASSGPAPTTRPADAAYDGGYLFVTFRGEQTPMTEQIYFATSDDGRHWTALNDGEPALVSTVGERGVRDPYLVRTPEGRFVLLATDLSIHLNRDWKRAGQQGSKSIVIWESDDLVTWTPPRLANIAPADAGCTWAPQAVRDEQTGDYLVYWSALTARDGFKTFRIWAARTRDFRTFGEPFVYIEKPTTIIDTDIVRDGDVYYRFTKNEARSTILMERAASLTGEWTDVPGYTLADAKGYEGPACFRLADKADGTPGGWCLLLDYYTKGQGYQPFVATDLAGGRFEPAGDFRFPFRFRHGAVLPITAAERERLRGAYPSTRPAVTEATTTRPAGR